MKNEQALHDPTAAANAATEDGPRQASLELSGAWQLRLDAEDHGISERWFSRQFSQGVPLTLPGSLPQQGLGNPVSIDTAWTGDIFDRSWFTQERYAPYRQPDNFKVTFWLQPEHHYVGAAWYQRAIEIPPAWAGRRVVLHLERPHWHTAAWLDDRALGTNQSLSVPHEYELGTAGINLPTGTHTLTLRVDNTMTAVDVGTNSHSVSDHTQGNWNGIVGRMELRATSSVWIDDLQVHPDAGNTVRVRGQVRCDAPSTAMPTDIALRIHGEDSHVIHTAVTANGHFEATCSLSPAAARWSEFNPALHRLTASLSNGEQLTITFGLRKISTAGTQFVIDGRKVFFRGTLDCCIFPQTGYPPTDVDAWRRIIRIAQSHGLNMLRFHSWCPPEAAFVAADELGMYFQVEVASWPSWSAKLGDGKPIDAFIYAEAHRILRAYGNHPSFVLLVSCNEPSGKQHKEFLSAWVDHFTAADDRRLVCCGSGWPELPENQFHVTPDPRIFKWGEGLKSRINASAPETSTDYRTFIAERTVPVISHEIGQWCVYPNFDEMPKYTGHLKPRNFEIFRESLSNQGMLDQARDFLHASGKLQTLCYKEEIESALRTPGMGGFQLLGLQDFPGQGTALVGMVDPFWDSKGYVTPEEFRRFCNATVVLAQLEKRVFTSNESLVADISVAHFGPKPLVNAVVNWTLRDDAGKSVAQGSLPAQSIRVDNGVTLGRITIAMTNVPAPARYRLVVGIEGTPFENDWDVWTYPAVIQTTAAANVVVTRELPTAIAALKQGQRVLLMVPLSQVRGDANGPVGLGFSSIFWNTAWTHMQFPHTLGVLCDPSHPALSSFPTDSHSNWQWWYPIHRAAAMILDELPREIRPIVQVIDDWFTNRKLALAFEARVRAGTLLVTSIDLPEAADPVCQQLFHSLLNYVASDRFCPSVELSTNALKAIVVNP